jgi:hypothetical protein
MWQPNLLTSYYAASIVLPGARADRTMIERWQQRKAFRFWEFHW